jgi:RNA polymerase sigma-70 factor (ECF subfamily)
MVSAVLEVDCRRRTLLRGGLRPWSGAACYAAAPVMAPPEVPPQPLPSAPPDPVSAEERALLEGLRRGDDDAFETLVRTFTARMLAVARRILRNEEDAREAVQDAFVSIFRGIGGFAGGARLSTWIHRVSINAALMKLRARKQVRERPIDDLLPRFDDGGHDLEPAEPWGESAAELVSKEESRELVRRLVGELPETYRVALMLRDIEELSTEEVARQLEVTPNAIKIRIHRARQALRARLDANLRTRSGRDPT